MESLILQGAAPISALRRAACGEGWVAVPNRHRISSLSTVDWCTLLRAILGASLESGHTIERLCNGDDIFPTMLASIRSANKSIEFLSFIFTEGRIARRFCDALIERADAGVRVRVLLDAVGAKALGNQLIEQLRSSPVDLKVFHPVSSWKIWRAPSRNHRKILVVDDRVAYTGGVGVADEWLGRGDQPGCHRDTHFRLTGPIVGQIKAAFMANRASSGGHLPDPLAVLQQHGKGRGGCPAAIVDAPAASKFSRIATLFQLMVRGAQQSVDIVTPYFVPGDALVKELIQAADRGVDINIMVSGRETDHHLPLYAGRQAYQPLLDAGIGIEEFDATLLHTKLFIVDRHLVVFGSPNVNQRSQSLDEELAVVACDRALARQLLDDREADRRDCRRIDRERWRRRSWRMRLVEHAARLFRSQI